MQKELFETRNTFLPTKQFSMYPTYLKAYVNIPQNKVPFYLKNQRPDEWLSELVPMTNAFIANLPNVYDKKAYENWIKDWKSHYKMLSTYIRELKIMRNPNTYLSEVEDRYLFVYAFINNAKICANRMLAVRQLMKMANKTAREQQK